MAEPNSVLRDAYNIVAESVLDEAFSGRGIGNYSLAASVDLVRGSDERLYTAPELSNSSLEVTWVLTDLCGRRCGSFRRSFYQHARTGEREVWLHEMRIDPDRRGGMRRFRQHGIDVLREAGFRRIRSNGSSEAGSYLLAREGFGFDLDRLPGFGAGEGIAWCGAAVGLPDEGDLVGILVERIIDGAVAGGRITPSEAALVSEANPRSPQALLAFPENQLSWRLLTRTRYPQVLAL